MFDRKKFVSNVTRHLHRRQTSPHTVSYADIRLYPTTAGFLYFLCIIGLFLLGINYQNNFVLITQSVRSAAGGHADRPVLCRTVGKIQTSC